MKIIFPPNKKNLPKELSVDNDSNPKPLMSLLLAAGIPVASSCQGDGVCGKCKIQIIQGMDNLSSQTPLEIQLAKKNKLNETERISCQTYLVKNTVSIDTPYW